MMTPDKKILSAKIHLLTRQPWFGQLSCYITPYEVKSVGTACINERGNLFYNPEFIDKLSTKQTVGLVCHEVLHLAYRHVFRAKKRHPFLWNIAADLKVNHEIVLTGNMELPSEGFIPDYNGSWKWSNITISDIGTKSTENIYDELYRKIPKVPQSLVSKLIQDLINNAKDGSDSDSGTVKTKDGTVIMVDVPASELVELERDWQTRVNQVNQSVGAGSIPAGLKRELLQLEEPELPWTQIIRQRLAQISRNRTWMRPAKKFLPQYFPGTRREQGLNAIVAIDTSGSMSEKDITKAVSETVGIADSFPSIHLWIMSNDAKVWDTTEVTNANKSKIKQISPQGGGGTDFNPVIKRIKDEFRNKIDCLIFFTDGYCYGEFPEKPPYQVYWVTSSLDVKWPYGKVIHIKS